MSTQILLIEDAQSLQLVYRTVLTNAGYTVLTAGNAAEGLAHFTASQPKIILLDLMLPDRSGLDLMGEFLTDNDDVRVVVITANGSIDRAVAAMRAGAFEFLVKPFDEARLINAVETAIDDSGSAHTGSPPALQHEGRFYGFIGSSREMRKIYETITSISRSMATVFISGQSGTGKEVCAQAVHDASNRANGPFVPLNCGAIPSDFLESEVFGHLKGSLPGAIGDKIGAAAAADGGTLFLDEICEMDLGLQTKLLRFLQTSTIQPVGAATSRKVNVRIICATNRDPFEEVQRGRLREDLFYRLHVVPIHLPQLSKRGNDVVEIAQEMLLKFAKEEGRHFTGLEKDVEQLFRRLPWPGNVRQLLNVLRNVVVLNDGETVTSTMLPMEILHLSETKQRSDVDVSGPALLGLEAMALGLEGLIGKTLSEIEQIIIEETIEQNGGSVTKAARVLDVSPSTIYRKRESWNLG